MKHNIVCQGMDNFQGTADDKSKYLKKIIIIPEPVLRYKEVILTKNW